MCGCCHPLADTQLLSWKRRESTRTKLLSLEGEAPHSATRALKSATTAANTEPEEPGRHSTLQSPGITACSGCTCSLSWGVWDQLPHLGLALHLLLDVREQETKACASCDVPFMVAFVGSGTSSL